MKSRKQELRRIQAAFDRFPQLVRLKEKRYLTRKKFVEDTFGSFVRQLRRKLKKK